MWGCWGEKFIKGTRRQEGKKTRRQEGKKTRRQEDEKARRREGKKILIWTATYFSVLPNSINN